MCRHCGDTGKIITVDAIGNGIGCRVKGIVCNEKKRRQREMEKEWYSWEYLLREDVRRLNYRFLKAQEAMMCFGRNSEEVSNFALSRLKQIILEECEKARRQGARKNAAF